MGGRCWEADVTDHRAIATVMDEVGAHFGGLQILVNNAGINSGGERVPIDRFSLEDWQRILQVDLSGVFVVSRAAVPLLEAGGGGRVVNISSVAGLVPLRLQSPFVAAKAGVINLTRSMALELGPRADPGQRGGSGVDPDARHRAPVLRRRRRLPPSRPPTCSRTSRWAARRGSRRSPPRCCSWWPPRRAT